MITFKDSFYNNLCIMCTSKKCQGSCKAMIVNNEADLKESLTQIITGLDKINMCNSGKGDLKSIYANSALTDINELKTEAKLLLDQVNGYTAKFPDAVAKCGSSYVSENVFE